MNFQLTYLDFMDLKVGAILFQHVFSCHVRDWFAAWFFELFPLFCLEIRAILCFKIFSDACKHSVPCGLSSELRLRRSSDFGRAPTLRRRRNGDSDTRERSSRSSMSATRDCALACNQHAVIGPLYVTSSIRTASAKNSNRAPGRPAGWAGERRYNSHF